MYIGWRSAGRVKGIVSILPLPARLKLKMLLGFLILVVSSCALFFAFRHKHVTFPPQGHTEQIARSSPTERLLRPSPTERRTTRSSTEKLVGPPSTEKSLRFSSYFSTVPRDLNSTTAASLPTPRELVKECEVWLRKAQVRRDQPCPSFPGGRLLVQTESVTLEELDKDFPDVETGGKWQPNQCEANRKMVIVIPFRDRQQHLNIFLRHMHDFLRFQLLDYRIVVAEQSEEERFNRAMLMNVGFTEALKVHEFDCVIFHDVDHLPEDTRNDYSCPTSPRHMSRSDSNRNYREIYKGCVGGVTGFWKAHFRKVNGFSNQYWGWGGEDDDLRKRIIKMGLPITRVNATLGRYRTLGHKKAKRNPDRWTYLRQAVKFLNTSGLNTLRYDVLSKQELPLYTLVKVRLRKNRDTDDGKS